MSFQMIELFETRKRIRENLSFEFLLDQLDIEVYTGDKIYSIYTNESKPSLKIDFQKNLFYCFSTGKGGDIVKFYMDYSKVDFKQAISDLCDYGLLQEHELSENEKASIRIRKKNLIISKPSEKELLKNNKLQNKVYDYIINELLNKDLPHDVKSYLFGNKRNLTSKIIAKYKIRAVNDMSKLKQELLSKYSSKELQIAGILNEKNNLIFYYHKIIIPYFKDDKITYLRFHHLPDGNTSVPKYLGLKGLTAKRIFNGNILKKLSEKQRLLLCEGEFDTLIAIQEGYNAIGFPGVTNIAYEELKKLDIGKYNLNIAFDNDIAGDKAARLFVQELGIECTRIKLRVGKDLTEAVSYEK